MEQAWSKAEKPMKTEAMKNTPCVLDSCSIGLATLLSGRANYPTISKSYQLFITFYEVKHIKGRIPLEFLKDCKHF